MEALRHIKKCTNYFVGFRVRSYRISIVSLGFEKNQCREVFFNQY